MTIVNCIVYGRIITNDNDPNISKGFAITLLILNIFLAMFSLFGFFYILLKWSKYREIKKQIFSTEQIIKVNFDKDINHMKEQHKNLYLDILQQPKVNYTPEELQNIIYDMKTKIPSISY